MHAPRSVLLLALCSFALLGLLSGCQKAGIDNNDAVKAAVLRHLGSRGDLGLGDLDIQVLSAKFEGDRCQAEVQFVPKGQPVEAGMAMKYTLVREGDLWKVQPNPNSGHGMQAPASSQAPNTPPPASGGEALPPGHPPVDPPSR